MRKKFFITEMVHNINRCTRLPVQRIRENEPNAQVKSGGSLDVGTCASENISVPSLMGPARVIKPSFGLLFQSLLLSLFSSKAFFSSFEGKRIRLLLPGCGGCKTVVTECWGLITLLSTLKCRFLVFFKLLID